MLKSVTDQQLTNARELLAGLAAHPPAQTTRSPYAAIVLKNRQRIVRLRTAGKSWNAINATLFGADAPALRTLKRLIKEHGIDKDAPKIRAARRRT